MPPNKPRRATKPNVPVDIFKPPEGIKLTGIQVTFSQENDSCSPTSEFGQDLTLLVEDAGGGPYIVMSTERWAINEEDVDWLAAVSKELLKNTHDLCFMMKEEDG